MINGYNVTLEVVEQVIFDNLSFVFDQDKRIGLVGRNGAGKSTLLKVISGKQALDSGSIAIARGKTIAYLSQDVVLQSDKTVVEEAYTAFEHIAALIEEQKQLEESFAETENLDEALERYAIVCEQLLHIDQDSMRSEAKKMLYGLGFKQEQLDAPVSTLSVGWKMRIVLAKLLLQKADFYLFDEPTNHLDIVAKEWFLQFLKRAPFGFVLVCHDRYFLNQLCNIIYEIDRGKGAFYYGDYTAYETQKAHNEALLEMQYKNQQREIKQKTETIERFKAKASKAGMAQSMMKALDKIELIAMPPKSPDITFTFPPIQQAGSTVLTVTKVSHSFGEKNIFNNVSFEVLRGKKVALVASNGVGKTTLFNLIAHKLSLSSGLVSMGHNVSYAVFDQDQTASLDLHKTILENIAASCSQATEQKIRAFAGAFLFTKDTINKKVGVLSGGEKNRVGMIKVLLQNANFLLLDEPTNHLDIQSKDILLKALQVYQGTILFVSHDQDFVNKLATDIVELSANGAREYPGNYELYLYQKQQEELLRIDQKEKYQNNSTQKKQEKNIKQTDIKTTVSDVKTLEKTIAKLEKEIATIEQKFEHLQFGTEDFAVAEKKLTRLKHDLRNAMQQWEIYHA